MIRSKTQIVEVEGNENEQLNDHKLTITVAKKKAAREKLCF